MKVYFLFSDPISTGSTSDRKSALASFERFKIRLSGGESIERSFSPRIAARGDPPLTFGIKVL